jgi:hypothetical protein
MVPIIDKVIGISCGINDTRKGGVKWETLRADWIWRIC